MYKKDANTQTPHNAVVILAVIIKTLSAKELNRRELHVLCITHGCLSETMLGMLGEACVAAD